MAIDQRFAVTVKAVDRKNLQLPPGEHKFEKTTKHADLCGEPHCMWIECYQTKQPRLHAFVDEALDDRSLRRTRTPFIPCLKLTFDVLARVLATGRIAVSVRSNAHYLHLSEESPQAIHILMLAMLTLALQPVEDLACQLSRFLVSSSHRFAT